MAITRPSPGPVSSPFGWRRVGSEKSSYHGGIDFVGAVGSPVRAVKDGYVYVAAPDGTYNRYGNLVVIRHDDATEAPYSLYAHLNSINTRKGKRVKAGQRIGTMGHTAKDRANPSHTVRTHLHFELLKAFPTPPDVGRIDPTPFLDPTSGFYPVPAPTPPSPTPVASTTSYGVPYQYTDYSYGQGPLRGLHGLGVEPCVFYPKCGPNAGKPVPCGEMASVCWTNNTPRPFVSAPGTGLSNTEPVVKAVTTLGLILMAPIALSWLFRDSRRYA